MASISEEFSGDCFDFDRLSVASRKRLFLIRGKIFHLVDPFQHRDVFSKELLGEFCQLHSEILNRFPVEMYLLFQP